MLTALHKPFMIEMYKNFSKADDVMCRISKYAGFLDFQDFRICRVSEFTVRLLEFDICRIWGSQNS